MKLHIVEGRYAVARLDVRDAIPSWVRGAFTSITRTRDELSIVCDDDAVPNDVHAERGWRCLAVEGPIPFSTYGVASKITTALADASISVFVVATYDTDYILVKEDVFTRACDALARAGFGLIGR
jgi:hypothetical protein